MIVKSMFYLIHPTFCCIPNPSKKPQANHFSINCLVPKLYAHERRCEFYDFHKELVPYAQAWSWQKAVVDEKKALNERNNDLSDTLIILQHNPVYTMGAGSKEEFLNFNVKNAPYDLYRTERGGEVTFHGPGQLVMYPIINLRYHKTDLHWYLRALEEVVIRALYSTFNIDASRVGGLTGVWVGNQKVAAIGIKVSKWIAYHGLALNVTTDTAPFKHIVPCGIRDHQVGSVKGLLQGKMSSPVCGDYYKLHANDDFKLIDITYKSMIKEFCEVFQVELRPKLGEFWRRPTS